MKGAVAKEGRWFWNLAQLGLAILLAAACGACAENPSTALNIEAGDASVRLKEFARQANVEIVYDAASVDGIHTNAVRGSLDPQDALNRMLEGTLLVAEKERQSGAFAVYRNASSELGRNF